MHFLEMRFKMHFNNSFKFIFKLPEEKIAYAHFDSWIVFFNYILTSTMFFLTSTCNLIIQVKLNYQIKIKFFFNI